ncbi:hypothetical protein OBBRIDRAFT_836295 [Obba rivulosa]|uniref:Uncharacterized protein n=1 Tax=Obba rivulosa TaxID=1052685 RepID=A0A8E2DJ90_9APHY|nr:hypothetical protein OBBRIDRAFT_836295 [Obba rivulosa]
MARVFEDGFAPYMPSTVPAFIASYDQREHGAAFTSEWCSPRRARVTFTDDANGNAEIDIEGVNVGKKLNANSTISTEEGIGGFTFGELFNHTHTHFLPYIEQCTIILNGLLPHSYDGIRKSPIDSLLEINQTFHELSNLNPRDLAPGIPAQEISCRYEGYGQPLHRNPPPALLQHSQRRQHRGTMQRRLRVSGRLVEHSNIDLSSRYLNPLASSLPLHFAADGAPLSEFNARDNSMGAFARIILKGTETLKQIQGMPQQQPPHLQQPQQQGQRILPDDFRKRVEGLKNQMSDYGNKQMNSPIAIQIRTLVDEITRRKYALQQMALQMAHGQKVQESANAIAGGMGAPSITHAAAGPSNLQPQRPVGVGMNQGQSNWPAPQGSVAPPFQQTQPQQQPPEQFQHTPQIP